MKLILKTELNIIAHKYSSAILVCGHELNAEIDAEFFQDPRDNFLFALFGDSEGTKVDGCVEIENKHVKLSFAWRNKRICIWDNERDGEFINGLLTKICGVLQF